MSDRTSLVKEVFERPGRYFGTRRFDVTIRVETVQALTENLAFERILDIGCGDGSMSVPLLAPHRQLTLLDLSQSMLALAQSKVPPEFLDRVEVRNQDFMTAKFSPEHFDLIICLGVLAHVDCPETFLARVASLLRPGGSLLVEFADSFHPVGRLSRAVKSLRELIKPARYAVNLLSAGQVFRIAQSAGLRFESEFRYALPPVPGLEILSHEWRYRMVRFWHGTYRNNRNAALGNLHICLFSRESAGSYQPVGPEVGLASSNA